MCSGIAFKLTQNLAHVSKGLCLNKSKERWIPVLLYSNYASHVYFLTSELPVLSVTWNRHQLNQRRQKLYIILMKKILLIWLSCLFLMTVLLWEISKMPLIDRITNFSLSQWTMILGKLFTYISAVNSHIYFKSINKISNILINTKSCLTTRPFTPTRVNSWPHDY